MFALDFNYYTCFCFIEVQLSIACDAFMNNNENDTQFKVYMLMENAYEMQKTIFQDAQNAKTFEVVMNFLKQI